MDRKNEKSALRNLHDEFRILTADELSLVAGGVTNAETALGSAFIKGFIAGGGTLGNPAPETPWPAAGTGECNTNHNSVKYRP